MPRSAEAETANPGIARPPLVYLVAIVAGVLLAFAWPLPFVSEVLSKPLGGVIVLVAIALFIASTGRFRAAGTPVPGNRPTTTIVHTGPYRFSRNPIYLAFSLLQLGIAIWVDDAWLIATLLVAMALMTWVVIRREERYLEAKFGAEYVDYKANVRRWI